MKAQISLLKSLLLAAILFVGSPIHAWEPLVYGIRIIFTMVEIQPGHLTPRSPIVAPEVGKVGHTLYFFDETPFVLNLYSVDEDGDETLEYTTTVSASTTEVQLPDSLSGTYIIEVVRDGLYFRGEIEI